MRDLLEGLGRQLCSPGPLPDVPPDEVRALAREALVVIPAGGFGYRMRSAQDGPGQVTQKALLPLPDGNTLISRLVVEYREAGCTEFLALVNHEGQAVVEHLDGGRPWGVTVQASFDPEPTGSGRTGALLHARRQGLVPPGRTLVVHNADCHVFDYPGSFPADLLAHHLASRRRMDCLATLAAVDGSDYPFTGMRIQAGAVTAVEMYPFIPVPTHTGITVLTPEAVETLADAPDEPGRRNFERDMFPVWAAAGRLAAMVLSHRNWVAVDDRKAYERFRAALSR